MIERAIPKAPRHLDKATRAWFDHVAGRFEMEEHHVRLLTLAGEAWDRGVQARQALSEHGLTFVDKYDCPRPRPEVAIERDSRMAFAKLLKELALDAALTPAAPLKSTRKYA